METNRKVIDITRYRMISGIPNIETLLCYATLLARGRVTGKEEDITAASDEYFKSIKQDCDLCPFVNVCLAVMITE